MGKRAPVTLRVNPDVDAKTHAKITTGTSETKFGIPFSQARAAYARAASSKGIAIVGIDVHIGSQITELEPFDAAFRRVAELVAILRADGHAITRLDLGGGLGVPYIEDNQPPPDPAAYGAVVTECDRRVWAADLIFEPGRLIAANAGVLVRAVIYVKQGDAKTFLILDAGMNDLIRPALYDSHHEIVLGEGTKARRASVSNMMWWDRFAKPPIFLPPPGPCRELKSGDLVAILSAGAYGAVMASSYNARPPAPEVLVKGAEWSIVRARLTHDELIAQDRIPGWLAGLTPGPRQRG